MGKDYKDSYVAFLDVLGFKEMIKEKSCADILKMFSSILSKQTMIEQYKKNYQRRKTRLEGYGQALDDTKIIIMSDSIVVVTPFNSATKVESLVTILAVCGGFQNQLYKMNPPVLLRGAVEQGKIYIEERSEEKKGRSIVFGDAYVKAYQAEEKEAIYPRIIIPPDLIGVIKKDSQENLYKELFLCKSPDDKYWYLNILKCHIKQNETNWTEQCEEEYQKLKKFIEDNMKNNIDENVRKKYTWLEEELNRIKNGQ